MSLGLRPAVPALVLVLVLVYAHALVHAFTSGKRYRRPRCHRPQGQRHRLVVVD